MPEPITCMNCGKFIGLNYSGQQDSESLCSQCSGDYDDEDECLTFY